MNVNHQPNCRTCGDYLVISPYRFATAKFCSQECRRVNTPEVLRGKKKQRRDAHPDKARAQQRERWKRWYENNREKERLSQPARGRKYWQKHRAEVNQRQKQSYWANPEKHRSYAAAWAKTNAGKIRTKRRARYTSDASYRLKCRIYTRGREARKRSASTGDAALVAKHLAARETFRCFYCAEIFPISKLHIDHVKPLCKGGAHAAYNLVPSCVSCNCHKQGTEPNKFIKSGQLLLVY